MNRLRNLSLRWQILLIVLVSGIPGFAAIVYAGWVAEAHLRGMVVEASTAAARHMPLEQRKLVAETRALLTRLGSLPGVSTGDFSACERQIRELFKFSTTYASFGLAGPDGQVVCSAFAGPHRSTMRDRPSFQQAIETRDFVVGGYQVGRTTGKASFATYFPILTAQGSVSAVAFAVVPIEWYEEMAEESHLPSGYAITVLDRDFTVLARFPRDHWIGKNIARHPLAMTVRAANAAGTAEVVGLDAEKISSLLRPCRDFMTTVLVL